jgi:flap endonuclease-1
MGIDGFWAWFDKNVKYETVLAEVFRGKYVGVDADNVMYKHRSVKMKIYTQKLNPFRDQPDHDLIDEKWIEKIVTDLIIRYMKDGQMPIFVFDGSEKDPLKLNELKRRSDLKAPAKKAYKKMRKEYTGKKLSSIPETDLKKGRQHLATYEIVPRASRDRFIQFIKDVGLPWIEAKTEGERVCALINRAGLTCATDTQDSDCIGLGGLYVIRERIAVPSGNGMVGAYKTAVLQKCLDTLGVELEKFQAMCIMAGTDFNEKISRVSFATSAKLIKQHGSIRRYGKATSTSVKCINYKEVKTRFDIIPWKDTVVAYSFGINPTRVESSFCSKSIVKDLVERVNKWKLKYGEIVIEPECSEDSFLAETLESES